MNRPNAGGNLPQFGRSFQSVARPARLAFSEPMRASEDWNGPKGCRRSKCNGGGTCGCGGGSGCSKECDCTSPPWLEQPTVQRLTSVVVPVLDEVMGPGWVDMSLSEKPTKIVNSLIADLEIIRKAGRMPKGSPGARDLGEFARFIGRVRQYSKPEQERMLMAPLMRHFRPERVNDSKPRTWALGFMGDLMNVTARRPKRRRKTRRVKRRYELGFMGDNFCTEIATTGGRGPVVWECLDVVCFSWAALKLGEFRTCEPVPGAEKPPRIWCGCYKYHIEDIPWWVWLVLLACAIISIALLIRLGIAVIGSIGRLLEPPPMPMPVPIPVRPYLPPIGGR
jgi:hypothetical protein